MQVKQAICFHDVERVIVEAADKQSGASPHLMDFFSCLVWLVLGKGGVKDRCLVFG